MEELSKLFQVKKISVQASQTGRKTDETQTESLREDEDLIDDSNETHVYRKKLRSHTDKVTLILCR